MKESDLMWYNLKEYDMIWYIVLHDISQPDARSCMGHHCDLVQHNIVYIEQHIKNKHDIKRGDIINMITIFPHSMTKYIMR